VVSGLNEYRAAIDALFARTGSTAKLGLERTEALLDQLGNPHRRLEIFHVAGTNGKGSVVATLDALLRSKGLRTGRYTSPHLVDFRERIVVDGEKIPEAEVLRFIREWEPEADRTGATFFELTTALAFDWFARQQVDVAVVETGLGGRLDSTNVVTPLVAGITSISIDHTEYLGDSIESIAAEKGGILKRGAPGVLGPLSTEARKTIIRVGREAGAEPLVDATDVFATSDVTVTRMGTQFSLKHDERNAAVRTGLFGVHQAANTSVALAMLELAGGAYPASIEEATGVLPSVSLPGRFQMIGDVILDVAHNPEGIAALITTLESVKPAAPIAFVLGVLADKDWKVMVSAAAAVADLIVLTHPPGAPSERRWDIDTVKADADRKSVRVSVEPLLVDALELARQSAATTVVTGSFYTVGAALQLLGASP
jgi:dihydrofolate synthase / folylpolyglutamate synthase